MKNKEIVEFFRERKKVINEMRELLGRQRKQEEYLKSERTYNPRVDKEEATTKLNEIKALQAFGNDHK